MTNITSRIKALGLLRWIFLISFIIAIGSFALIFIAFALGSDYQFSGAAGTAYSVLTIIFSVGHFLVIILSAATFILTFRVNSECRLALYLGICAAVLSIVSCVLSNVSAGETAGSILGLIGDLTIAVALFALIDGIFEKQARKEPLFHFALLGICLMVVYAVLSFVNSIVTVNSTFSAIIYTVGAVSYILSSLIVFMGLNSCLNTIKQQYQESEA